MVILNFYYKFKRNPQCMDEQILSRSACLPIYLQAYGFCEHVARELPKEIRSRLPKLKLLSYLKISGRHTNFGKF